MKWDIYMINTIAVNLSEINRGKFVTLVLECIFGVLNEFERPDEYKDGWKCWGW